jgi:hypothetical protein
LLWRPQFGGGIEKKYHKFGKKYQFSRAARSCAQQFFTRDALQKTLPGLHGCIRHALHCTKMASVQPELAIQRPELGRFDELGMANHDTMQRPIELFAPKHQEFEQHRKLRREIIVLPDISLQQPRMIGQMIEDTRGGKPLSGKLLDKIGMRFDLFGCGHCNKLRAPYRAERAKAASPFEKWPV